MHLCFPGLSFCGARVAGWRTRGPTSTPFDRRLLVRPTATSSASTRQELGQENLEERLTSATRSPAQPAHRLAQLIADVVPTGRPVLVLELARGPHVASSAALGELAAAALAAGADALAVKTDSEDTPEPLKDVLAATQAAAAAFERQRPPPRANPFAGPQPGPAPVLQRDW